MPAVWPKLWLYDMPASDLYCGSVTCPPCDLNCGSMTCLLCDLFCGYMICPPCNLCCGYMTCPPCDLWCGYMICPSCDLFCGYDMSAMWHILWVYDTPPCDLFCGQALTTPLALLPGIAQNDRQATVFVGRSCTPYAFFLFWEVICNGLSSSTNFCSWSQWSHLHCIQFDYVIS